MSPAKSDSGGISRQAARFAGVGAAGFAIDLVITLLCVPLIGPALGRIVALLIAVAATYGLNRRVTFNSGNRDLLGEFVRYALVSAVGAGVNFAGYSAFLAAIHQSGLPGGTATSLVVAVAAGSALALGFNFCGARLFAFAR